MKNKIKFAARPIYCCGFKVLGQILIIPKIVQLSLGKIQPYVELAF